MCAPCPISPTSTTTSSPGPPRQEPPNRSCRPASSGCSSTRWTGSTSPTPMCDPGPPSTSRRWWTLWPTWSRRAWPTPPTPGSTSTWTSSRTTGRWCTAVLTTSGREPGLGSTSPRIRTTRWTSPSGRRPSPASQPGTPRGGPDGPAGTSNAWPCRSACWATDSTSTAEATTWCSPTMRTNGLRRWAADEPSPAAGSTTGWSRWTGKRCPNR